MLQKNFFNVPETKQDLIALWTFGEPAREMRTVLDDPDEPDAGWKYLGNTTWAYIIADHADIYRRELEEMRESGILIVSDDSDGCVSHLYLKDPR